MSKIILKVSLSLLCSKSVFLTFSFTVLILFLFLALGDLLHFCLPEKETMLARSGKQTCKTITATSMAGFSEWNIHHATAPTVPLGHRFGVAFYQMPLLKSQIWFNLILPGLR